LVWSTTPITIANSTVSLKLSFPDSITINPTACPGEIDDDAFTAKWLVLFADESPIGILPKDPMESPTLTPGFIDLRIPDMLFPISPPVFSIETIISLVSPGSRAPLPSSIWFH
jgi:hypothetical protein